MSNEKPCCHYKFWIGKVVFTYRCSNDDKIRLPELFLDFLALTGVKQLLMSAFLLVCFVWAFGLSDFTCKDCGVSDFVPDLKRTRFGTMVLSVVSDDVSQSAVGPLDLVLTKS